MANSSSSRLKVIFVGLWLLFTISLSSWWIIFGLRQLDKLKGLNYLEGTGIQREQQMLLWEGGVLVVSLLGGGLALLYYIYKERARHQQVEDFFKAFTHDLKTSLTSLRLQTESLEEDLDKAKYPVLDRLVQDTVRLQLQLENSLFMGSLDSAKLLNERVPLRKIIETLKHHWPNLDIVLNEDVVVKADSRALESILRNIFHNSVIHGHATLVNVKVAREGNKVNLSFQDNGKGFQGDISKLGELYLRPTPSSGSGVGLFISKRLAKRMGGDLRISNGANGFSADVELGSLS